MAEPLEPEAGPNRTEVLAEIRALFLGRLATSAQTGGVYSAAALEALRQGTGKFFDDMVAGGGRIGFEGAQGLTASNIVLVDDNQLELSIRLGDLSRRIDEDCSHGLFKLYQRFVTLLDRPDLAGTDNPVSPEGICRGLAEMFAELRDAHEHSLARLAEIARVLADDLPVLYAELNQLMARHHVRAAKTQAQPGREGGAARGGAVRGADPLAGLQQAIYGRMMPAGQATAGSAGTPIGMAGASAAAGAAGDAGGANPAAAAYGAAMFEQLMGRLNQWQHQGQADLFGGEPAGSPQNALQALKGGEAGTLMRAQETAALDVLAALFDALFDDPRLADAVKAALARLQIPLLKAAMLDASFFNDRNHPARALLDTMGEAAAALGPDVDGEHPVCAELRRVAIAVQAGFERDTEVFSDHAAELETFMARRNHDLQAEAQAFVALARIQEERDLATQMAHRVVAAQAISAAPPVVAEFLRREWRQVLEGAWLAGGEEADAWRDATGVVRDLLASVQPKPDPDERRQVAMLIPGLLRKIRAGLDQIGVTAEARAPFLDACFALQTAVLRGKPPAAEAAPAGDVLPAAELRAAGDSAVEVGVLEMNGLKLKSLRLATPIATSADDSIDSLAIGDWVEFQMPDGASCRGRLCWFSPTLANPLFANPDWDCAISVARPILDRQLATGRALVGGGQSLFDDAAEKALRRSS